MARANATLRREIGDNQVKISSFFVEGQTEVVVHPTPNPVGRLGVPGEAGILI